MGDPRKRRSDATCMAVTGEDEADLLASTCGKPATQEREIEDTVFPLCDEHAAEVDADLEDDENEDE
jgi:hypothetical protein